MTIKITSVKIVPNIKATSIITTPTTKNDLTLVPITKGSIKILRSDTNI